MEKETQKIIDTLKSVQLTADEKSAMQNRILIQMGKVSTPSPFYGTSRSFNESLFSFFQGHERAASSFAFLLIFFITGGGFVFAAQYSLPGDVLYPIKIKVNESILRNVYSRTPSESVSFETGIMEQRLVEAETLQKQDKLNSLTTGEIHTEFLTQEWRVEQAVVDLVAENSASTSIAIDPAASSSRSFAAKTVPQAQKMRASFSANQTLESTSTATSSAIVATTTASEPAMHDSKQASEEQSNSVSGSESEKAILRINSVLEAHQDILNKIDDQNGDEKKNFFPSFHEDKENTTGIFR